MSTLCVDFSLLFSSQPLSEGLRFDLFHFGFPFHVTTAGSLRDQLALGLDCECP